MQGQEQNATDAIQSRFSRNLARLAETGTLVRWELDEARRDFAKATLAHRLAPRSPRARRELVRAYFRLRDAAKAVEVAR